MTGGRPKLSAPVVVVALGLTAGVAALAYSQIHARALEIASATASTRAWELKGPDCPPPSGWSADPKYAPAKTFIFNGIKFARRTGHADCSAVAAPKGQGLDYVPLCQFTGPLILEITTDKGVYKFAPPAGNPATVSVVHGVAKCVVAANADF